MSQQLIDLAISKSLPDTYVDQFLQFVAPMVDVWLDDTSSNSQSIWGIQGCQGSGKTTISEFIALYLQEKHQRVAAVCSIDDFYLTKQERQELAAKVHPLLQTRGVPGTHDTGLINKAFTEFRSGQLKSVPFFNKAIDDRAPQDEWSSWDIEPSILIFEGWCVGISAQHSDQLDPPINALESEQDSDGNWRAYVNNQLQASYAEVFTELDRLLTIQAPSFDCVFNWRLQQEQQLAAKIEKTGGDASGVMSEEQVRHFISHYQRLTEHAFANLSDLADATLMLNLDHSFASLT